jgi:nucleoside-diphosphate-sugar epimerase
MAQTIKNIFITGALGLVGRELVKSLLKEEYKLTCIDLKKQINRNKKFIKESKNKNLKFIQCDILDKKKIHKITKNQDCIIHLAAMLGVENTEKRIKKCWDINVHGVQNIIDAYNKNKIKKIIFSSSSEVYGEAKKIYIDEQQPLLGRNIYACSKIAGENIILNNQIKNKKTDYTIFRLFNTYGQGQVAQFFIPKICKLLREGKKIIINGKGNQIRGYSYASDIANGIKLSISKPISRNKIYNIGNSYEVYSLLGVLKKLNEIKNFNRANIIHRRDFKRADRNEDREIFKRICNTNKIRKELGFVKKIKLIDGLKMTICPKNKIYNFW